MGAKSSEVVATVCVGLELEQRLVVRVVGGVLAQRGAGRRRLRLRSKHRLGVRHFLYLLKELGFRLDSVKMKMMSFCSVASVSNSTEH